LLISIWLGYLLAGHQFQRTWVRRDSLSSWKQLMEIVLIISVIQRYEGNDQVNFCLRYNTFSLQSSHEQRMNNKEHVLIGSLPISSSE